MKIFREFSQCQGLLLPPSLDEFVPKDHEARIVNEAVDTMDLSPFFTTYEGGGAPAYHPTMMLKVIIYSLQSGHLQSSRSIAFDGTKLKANASVRQTRDRQGLEKEIERIKEQIRQS